MDKLLHLKLHKLISKFKDGDDSAFSDIYSLTYKKVYFLTLNIIKDPFITEDIVQEVYVKVFKSLKNLKDDKLFIAWISKIAYNQCIKEKSKLEKIDTVNIDIIDYVINDDKNSNMPLDKFIEVEGYNHLISLLDKLPEIHSTVLVMKYLHMMKISEISYALDISEGTVKSRINNGKKGLAKLYFKNNYNNKVFGFMYYPIFISSANSINMTYINHNIKLNKILYDNVSNTHALFNPYLSSFFNHPFLYLCENLIAITLASAIVSLPILESDLVSIELNSTQASISKDNDITLSEDTYKDKLNIDNKDIESPYIDNYFFKGNEFVISLKDNISGVDYDSIKFKDINHNYIDVDFKINNSNISIVVDDIFSDIAFIDISDFSLNTTTYSVLDMK